MKEGWETKKLGEILRLQYGKPLSEADRTPNGSFPVYGANGEIARSNRFYHDKPSIIVGRKGSASEITFTERKFWPLDVTYFVTFDHRTYDLPFLYCLLSSVELPRLAKGVKPGINREEVYALAVAVPPLAEQRRIVAILDEAFAEIDTAKANIERNLENAREVFESELGRLFQSHEGLPKVSIATVAEVFDGPHATPKTVDVGPVYLGIASLADGKLSLAKTRHVTPYDFRQWTRRVLPRANDVIFSYETQIGEAAIIPEGLQCCLGRRMGLVRTNRARLEPRYFLYQYISSPFREFLMSRTVHGATVDRISIKEFPTFPVLLPHLSAQRAVVQKLDHIRSCTDSMVSLCERKLAALEELKKSLLHQAFTGELTAHKPAVAVAAPAASGPAVGAIAAGRARGPSTTDLHPGILAMAYEAHERRGKEALFGHVKAEKVAHMVEAHVGIDLGRSPVKDAAGPDDFRHLKLVESRARKAGWFDFAQRGERYELKKLSGFDRLVDKTRAALGSRATEVDRLIELMLPLDTRRAEVFCTVYAAWNNLLLEGKSPTEEEIVRAAREDWHPGKLQIPGERFFAAIEWMKEHGLTPSGKGKAVGRKVSELDV